MRLTAILVAATNPFLKLLYDQTRKKSLIQTVQYWKNACIQRFNKISHECCPASSFIELQIRDLCYLTPRLLNSKMTKDVSRIERNLCAPVFSDYVAVFYARHFFFFRQSHRRKRHKTTEQRTKRKK